MDKPKIETITIKAAVARMINLLEPSSVGSPIGVTEIMHAQSEEEYKSNYGKTTKEHHRALLTRGIACRQMFMLAISLQQALEFEVKDTEHSVIDVVDWSGREPLMSVESVTLWALLYFHVHITDWDAVRTTVRKITRWEYCVIKIYDGDKIGLFKGKGDRTKYLFQDFDLMGRRKKEPNKIGNLLIWLSLKQPTSEFPGGITRKDMSLLRDVLRKLTGLSGDPFYPVIEKDNYMPRFKIINDISNAAERGKQKAVHAEFDDSQDYGQLEKFLRQDDEDG